MAERIQLRRTAGFRLAPGAIVITRCGWCTFCRPEGRRGESGWLRRPCYGNPFTVANALESGYAATVDYARGLCVEAFRSWLNRERTWAFSAGEQRLEWLLAHLDDLRGHDLACTCAAGAPCHGDVYFERLALPVGG